MRTLEEIKERLKETDTLFNDKTGRRIMKGDIVSLYDNKGKRVLGKIVLVNAKDFMIQHEDKLSYSFLQQAIEVIWPAQN